MALPYFFVADLQPNVLTLDEDTSKHVVGVLRMTKGEELMLTDGKGLKARASITDDNRKRCTVRISDRLTEPEPARRTAIAISLVKNASRFEWFLEKSTELGITEILPIICERTEREKFRSERLEGILISALLQSQQSRMPRLHPPTDFRDILNRPFHQRFIAHCLPEQRIPLATAIDPQAPSQLVLIGPEGDFTPREISEALESGFCAVTLGNTRLRTETAGMTAAVLLSAGQAQK